MKLPVPYLIKKTFPPFRAPPEVSRPLAPWSLYCRDAGTVWTWTVRPARPPPGVECRKCPRRGKGARLYTTQIFSIEPAFLLSSNNDSPLAYGIQLYSRQKSLDRINTGKKEWQKKIKGEQTQCLDGQRFSCSLEDLHEGTRINVL